MSSSNKRNDIIRKATRSIVEIERRCFYGAEPEVQRLKRIRELIDRVSKEVVDENQINNS
ncbi:MAG: hypothetical protein IBX55_15840 [Methyloprofundus sp.]|nr:hypothetical protein [Methyloprofundus sp.]